MEVGKEFSTWNQFSSALKQYSKKNKVSYSIGACRTVESANIYELDPKFPLKLKYCYVRMVCNHIHKNNNENSVKEGDQKTHTSCCSSIFVVANSKRRSLFIQESNLIHNHESFNFSFSDVSHIDRTSSKIANVLINIGVSPLSVHNFVSKSHDTILSVSQSEPESEGDGSKNSSLVDIDFISDIEEILAADPDCIIEMINFNTTPGAVYIQMSEMKESCASFSNKSLQIITHRFPGNKFITTCIVGIDEDLKIHPFAIFFSPSASIKTFQYSMETFVKYNEDYCDSCKGIVINTCLENVDFIRYLMPQANIAWSKSFTLQKFEEFFPKSISVSESQLSLFRELINSDTEQEYNTVLRNYLETFNSIGLEDFLSKWDSHQELWAGYKICSLDGLKHQKSALEVDFVNNLFKPTEVQTSIRKIVHCYINYHTNGEVFKFKDIQKEDLKLSSCNAWYKSLCHAHAAEAIICQAAVSDHSKYNVYVKNDGIFVKRVDSEEEFFLSKGKCSCDFNESTELPCQHIFACLKTTGKPYCDESLIPSKWKAVTSEYSKCSGTDGNSTASVHQRRFEEIQSVVKKILYCCQSHSFDELGDDLILLKKSLRAIKKPLLNCDKNVSSSDSKSQEDANQSTENVQMDKHVTKNKKDKIVMSQNKSMHSSNAFPSERRHNLRTNIKHKFVSRGSAVLPKESSSKANVSRISVSEHIANDNAVKRTCRIESKDHIHTDFCDIKAKDSPAFTDSESKIEGDQAQTGSGEKEGKDKIGGKETLENKKAPGALSKKDLKRSLLNEDQGPPEKKVPTESQMVNESNNSRETDFEDGEDNSEDERGSYVPEDESDDEFQSNDKEDLIQRNEELKDFLENLSLNEIQQVVQEVSTLEPPCDRNLQTQHEEETPKTAVAYLFTSHSKDEEALDIIMKYLCKTCFGYERYAYKVAACIIFKAFIVKADVCDMLQMLRDWPNHLPQFEGFEENDPNLFSDQNLTNLTVCGHKLSVHDINTLKTNVELSPGIIHAYLEILAQRHIGKLFVIPFEIIHHWRNGNFSHLIFKKVHFKTFDFLVLPIHCGSEFSDQEVSEPSENLKPYWMVLIADIHNKTVSVLNPRCEDKYAIAANGYMLQWRKYMQIRSVHTGEMLLTWSYKKITCTKQTQPDSSGSLLLMNVEAVINNAPPSVMVEAHIKRYLQYMMATLRDMDRETTVLCVGGPECQKMAARDADWLQCENCHAWWHRACAGHVDQSSVFYCTSCQQRIIGINTSGDICRDEESEIRGVEMMEEEEEEDEEDNEKENDGSDNNIEDNIDIKDE